MSALSVWPTDALDGSVANEARWRKMARLWSVSGVELGRAAELAPSLAGLNLTIGAGACWVDGHYAELAGDQVLAVTANGLAVVRFDPAANTAELLYRDAVSAPTQNPTGTWEIPIARIAGSALTDARMLVHPLVPGGIVPNNTARDLNIPAPRTGLSVIGPNGEIQTYTGTAWASSAAQSSAFTIGAGQPGPVAVTATFARWQRVGSLILAHGAATVNAAGVAGSPIAISTGGGLPGAFSSAAGGAGGTFKYFDAGSTIYTGTVDISTAGTLQFNVSGNGGYLGVSPNMAMASGDAISFSLQYFTTVP